MRERRHANTDGNRGIYLAVMRISHNVVGNYSTKMSPNASYKTISLYFLRATFRWDDTHAGIQIPYVMDAPTCRIPVDGVVGITIVLSP